MNIETVSCDFNCYGILRYIGFISKLDYSYIWYINKLDFKLIAFPVQFIPSVVLFHALPLINIVYDLILFAGQSESRHVPHLAVGSHSAQVCFKSERPSSDSGHMSTRIGFV